MSNYAPIPYGPDTTCQKALGKVRVIALGQHGERALKRANDRAARGVDNCLGIQPWRGDHKGNRPHGRQRKGCTKGGK